MDIFFPSRRFSLACDLYLLIPDVAIEQKTARATCDYLNKYLARDRHDTDNNRVAVLVLTILILISKSDRRLLV